MFFFLFLSLFFSTVQSHILIIPYPYYNREYAINSTKYIAVNQLPIIYNYVPQKAEKRWEFVFNGVGFYRTAERAYDVLSQNKYLAAAFHGRSEFDLSDLSPNSKILYIKNNTDRYKDILKDNEYIKYEGSVKPIYQLEEYGITLAADIVRKLSKNMIFLCQLRLPLINKSIYHDQNWNDIKYSSNAVGDDRVYLDSLNRYFKVRVDYLLEKGMIPEIRSTTDFKKINGAAFFSDNHENYFLEKPYLSEKVYFEQSLLEDDNAEGIDDKNSIKKIHHTIAADNWYAMTEFDQMAMPTTNSLLLYTKLIESNDRSCNGFLNAITQGKFLGKNYNWNTVRMSYVAPLDIQFNITKLFDHENIILQGLCAFVIPIKNTTIMKDNYIGRSFFKDQYALRFGSQMTYDINQYYKLLFYGSWQYYFPGNQIIPAIFENVMAYGLSPLYLQGKVSWYEWYLATHIVIKYNDNAGIDLGYQYIYKAGDTIIPECENFYLINGQTHKLNYLPWKEFSASIANLLGINFYYYCGAFQFDFGMRGLVAGKNIIKLQEFSMRVGIDF